jgi:prolipoprotein diacylglyceryl transferase
MNSKSMRNQHVVYRSTAPFARIISRPLDLLFASFEPGRAFRVSSGIGVAIGMPLAILTAAHVRLSLGPTIVVAVAGIVTLLATGMVAKILTGEESFVYFRDILPIFAVMAGVARMIHQPVLMYLDIMAVGAGAFLACGRIGCLLVGCCHGRPSRWGIRYGESHAECGFPSHYVGVRLFPVQAVESLFVFCLVAIGAAIVWKGAPPGTVLSFYVTAYAVGRFFIEFARGDAERSYFWNFSEAQWTSAGLLWAVVFAEHIRVIPASKWHPLAAIGLILCMGVIAAKRRLDGSRRFQLRHPHHVRELAQAMRQISEVANTLAMVPVFTTSCSIRISGSGDKNGAQGVQHYCFSSSCTALTPAEADILARTIALLRKERGPLQLLQGRPGIFHLLLASAPNGPEVFKPSTPTLRARPASGQQPTEFSQFNAR